MCFFPIGGNFGLCRKKTSGSSVRLPLHRQKMFFEQDEVDKYVENYGTMKVTLSKVRLSSTKIARICHL